MTFLPSLEVMLAYTAAGIVLVITPGPDMTLFLGQTLTGGRARGMAAYLGASAGLVVHTMLAAFGLSALLAASATAFGVLKVAGVAYLVWLAIDALRRGSALTLQPGAAEPQPLSRVFLMGVAVNLLNPKIVMFFLTFLPQFVSASDPHAGAKLMFLGLYFIVLAHPDLLRADRHGRPLHRRDPPLAARDARDRLAVRHPDGRVRGQASVRAGGLNGSPRRAAAMLSAGKPASRIPRSSPRPPNRQSRPRGRRRTRIASRSAARRSGRTTKTSASRSRPRSRH